MSNTPRCLYNSSFEKFINADDNLIFGALCDNYHGDALTTTREAWKTEITIMQNVIATMYETGQNLRSGYKETALAGLARNALTC